MILTGNEARSVVKPEWISPQIDRLIAGLDMRLPIVSCQLGTMDTATALGSAVTAVAGIRSGSITLKHNLKTDRLNCCGAGRKDKPIPGNREISGSLVAEYVDASFRDAIVNDTSLTIVKTFTSGTDVLQVIVPDVRIEGDIVKASNDLALQDIKWVGLDGLSAAQPIWIVCRTADTAL